jgi:glycosyltransferase involved in cell wall biosynthesis
LVAILFANFEHRNGSKQYEATMLVSVALPVYNGLPYLSGAIATILAQDIHFELIVSDDMSRDGSAEVIRELSDPRIRILTNETNAGIFGNMNRCIAAARGDLIQFFSQDDLMKSGYLASQVRSLQNNPGAGLVYGTPDYIDEKGSFIPSDLRDGTPEYIDRDLYLWIASHYGALPASISSIMIPRRTFEVVGPFNPDYRVAGDIEFYNRVSERFPILRNMEVLHSVRSHPRATSALSTAGPLYLQEELALEEWYRSRWSADDYRKIRRFRSASRGGYHLSWIVRKALRGRFGETLSAVWRLNKIYPLHLVVWWRVSSHLRPDRRPLPTVPPARV